MMTFRLASSRYRVKEILDIMVTDTISQPDKIEQLKKELSEHFENTTVYNKAKTMGQVVKIQMKKTLQKNLMLIPKTKIRFDD